jgi:hypothetical protein
MQFGYWRLISVLLCNKVECNCTDRSSVCLSVCLPCACCGFVLSFTFFDRFSPKLCLNFIRLEAPEKFYLNCLEFVAKCNIRRSL